MSVFVPYFALGVPLNTPADATLTYYWRSICRFFASRQRFFLMYVARDVYNVPQAAYGSANPLYAVRQHAQSSMRASIGELELDEILHARSVLTTYTKKTTL